MFFGFCFFGLCGFDLVMWFLDFALAFDSASILLRFCFHFAPILDSASLYLDFVFFILGLAQNLDFGFWLCWILV
ncbi:hypothetical protein BKN38_00675 [Helicobacter sp. CLO-3]|nr:hypothetical protein BA723_02790 [Helicobacter sp. CLO-3]OHU85574.1 hypothetical protein BKN38_00675 [Helicobacter sp. CLO-3]